MDLYRIHGDNIVECERIAQIIINKLQPNSIISTLISPATVVYKITFEIFGYTHEWTLELLPGFNKARRQRWDKDIFDSLKENGSLLNETPDAIITKVSGMYEKILCAIEFCSALQAGNQAWQRSGRAFSTGRTGCPYLYIVDFVKYELDKNTRERIALRYPNPSVPYSYINFSKATGNFIAQVYLRSEEFDKTTDATLSNFDEKNFAEEDLSNYITKLMMGLDTSIEEESILNKNLNVVLFLAEKSKGDKNLTVTEWEEIYSTEEYDDIVDYLVHNSRFNFHKKITQKGHYGKSRDVLALVEEYSIGLTSQELPCGIIPSNERAEFASKLKDIYPVFDEKVIRNLASDNKNLILCIAKGFKPHGEDARPDRGILPLAAMLSSENVEIMTYIYGPVLSSNYKLLLTSPDRLANTNGLWKAILALSNYVMLDAPIINGDIDKAEIIVDTTEIKNLYANIVNGKQNNILSPIFPSVPRGYHEDDVDTGIHYIFTHLLADSCFEGMCNPPGGDWSGFSVIFENKERRWLSLPRVSDTIHGKRPDHIIEMFNLFDKPLLLSVESKEKSGALEPNVGIGLINYIKHLMNFVPNVEKPIMPCVGTWNQSNSKVDADEFVFISAAAYLKKHAQSNEEVFRKSKCEVLFIMEPYEKGWNIEIVPSSEKSHILKEYLISRTNDIPDANIKIF